MNFFDLSNIHLYIAIGISVVNAVLMCFVGYKFLQILQLSNYKNRGYWSWLKDTRAKYISRIFMLCLLSSACMLVTNFLLNINNLSIVWSYLGLLFYLYFVSIFIYNLYNAPRKTPLKITSRMSRLRIALVIIVALLTFGLIALSSELVPSYRFAVVAITPLFLPIIIPFINMVLSPFEKANSVRYMMSAKRKLKKMPNLIKIGITGSFGKTSTKMILSTILSEKYSVCASPYSYNTPMGITKSVIQFLDFSHQVFIAEMGARFKGDIKELCELVEPQYGILLGIGNQHLQTFGTMENIVATKAELVDYLSPNGVSIFDGTNRATYSVYESFTGEKAVCGLNNKSFDLYAENIKVTNHGTTFDLCAKNGDKINCSTILLGEHNIQNILCASCLALKLGLNLEEIKNGINKIQPIEHRLQLIHNNDVTILDDSYNGSVEGARCALNVLSLFEGKKIVVTPGLVELGKEEKQANIDFGESLSKITNEVIIVNVAHSLDIKQGLINGGFDETKIYQAPTLEQAQSIIKRIITPKCNILFYNDLPDNYT